eukprot:GHRQ01029995.1.p1 GENE.GHRQ01029995.1~~GHRQ01029995.1.p1  ORF type:complete len:128 (+),score=14.27 GHRQ01029995.1:368-751(+)
MPAQSNWMYVSWMRASPSMSSARQSIQTTCMPVTTDQVCRWVEALRAGMMMCSGHAVDDCSQQVTLQRGNRQPHNIQRAQHAANDNVRYGHDRLQLFCSKDITPALAYDHPKPAACTEHMRSFQCCY